MKVLAIVPITETKYKKYKIDFYTIKSVDIPFELVVQNNITDWESNKFEDTYKLGYHLKATDIRLSDIRLKDKPYKFNGFICYQNLENLVEFLVEYYIPTNDFVVDRVLKMSKRLNKRKKKSILLEVLLREKLGESVSKWFHSQSSGWSLKNNQIAPVVELSALLGRSLDVKQLVIPEGLAFFHISDTKRIIYLKNYISICTKTIPVYCKFWIFIANTNMCFYWDGNIANCYCPAEINREFLTKITGEETFNKFNKYAKSIEITKEYFPPPDFKIDFLLRVPSKQELRTAVKDIGENIPVKFSKLLFLYDTRGAIKLNKDYPIIDSVSDACSILSRAPNWIALPDDYSSRTSLEYYIENKEYYIACGRIE